MSIGTYGNITSLSNHQRHLPRPRIDMLLASAIEHPFVAVIAGAGCGKTQAVSMFLKSVDVRTVWFQLTKLDNLSIRFWDGFIGAVAMGNKEFSSRLQQLGFPESLSDFNQFLHLFTQEIYNGEQLVLVFDDYHRITDEPVIDFIENLINAKLENFCILISSRTELNFSPDTMTNNSIAVISMKDLLFSPSETEEYFKLQGLKISLENLDKIYTVTKGWPFALNLICVSVEKNNYIPNNPVAGALPAIFDLIDTALFSGYTPEMQNLLVRFSLFDDLPTDLIKEIAGNTLEATMEIIMANPFIYYNPHTCRYYFHNLFMKFLKQKQIYLTEQEIAGTYLQAADLCFNNKRKFDAYAYYDKCNRYDKILYLLEHNGPETYPKETADFLIKLIESFPENFVDENPAAHIMHAGLLLNNAMIGSAIKVLSEAEKKLKSLPLTEKNKIALGEIQVIFGQLAFPYNMHSVKEHFKKACEYLPNGSAYFYSGGPTVGTKNAFFLNHTSTGALKEMEEALFDTVPYAAKAMNGFWTGLDYLASAEAAYFTGDMDKAVKSAYQAIYRAREKTIPDILASGYFLLTRVAVARGRYKDAVTYRKESENYFNSLDNRQSFQYMIDVAQGWFYVMVGQTDKVADWITDDIQRNKTIAPYNCMGRDFLIKAYCFLKQKKYYELLALMNPQEEMVQQRNMMLILLDVQIFKACAYYHIGEESQAVTALQTAYNIAHENNLIMQFAEIGNDMRAVTTAVKHVKGHRIPSEWLDEIHAKASTYAKRLAFITAEYNAENKLSGYNDVLLSKREKEVLLNLCQGLTREEISESLCISSGTVKSVLNNIYNKLGAINGIDAVMKATKMKLI